MSKFETYLVTTSEDSVKGSLRYAIDKTNKSSVLSKIEITPEVSESNITLTGGEIKISSNVKITNKTGHDLSIIGGFNERLFNILEPSTRTIFDGLTLTGGQAQCNANGGAINVKSSNHTLILDNVTISNNKAVKGGAIHTKGQVILNSSTIKENEALNQGGAIWSELGVVLINSQVSHNLVLTPLVSSAGGGVFVDNGDAVLNNSSITHNRVAHNDQLGGSGGGLVVMVGNIYVQNHSHVDHNQAFNSGGIQMGKGDIYITNASSANHNKSTNPVQESGGGGGVTITQGDVFVYHGQIIGNETSGMFSGGIVSLIGDVSIEHSKVLKNTNKGPGGGLALNIGNLSVHASIISENTGASLGGAIVNFTPGGYIYINASKITNNILTNDETIAQTIKAFISVITGSLDTTSQQAKESGGSGSQKLLTLLPEILSKLTTVSDLLKEKLQNLVLTNHIAGGAIASLLSTKITLINSDVEDNTFQNTLEANSPFISLGGGVFNYKGLISLDKTTIKGNTGANIGGGIYSGVNLLTTNATIEANTAINAGGIYTDGSATILSSTITGNESKFLGGGIQSEGNLTLISSFITENTSTRGGGIYTTGDLIVFDTEINQNIPNNIVKV